MIRSLMEHKNNVEIFPGFLQCLVLISSCLYIILEMLLSSSGIFYFSFFTGSLPSENFHFKPFLT